MTAASDIQQLRRKLYDYLPADPFTRLNMATIAQHATRLRDLGWTPDDITSQIVGSYGTGDPAALIVARIQQLDGPPPREATPTPPPVAQVLAEQRAGHTPAADPAAWAARIRDQLRHRDHDGEGAA